MASGRVVVHVAQHHQHALQSPVGGAPSSSSKELEYQLLGVEGIFGGNLNDHLA